MIFFKKIEINSRSSSSKKGTKKEKTKKATAKDKWFDVEGELVVDVYQTDSEIVVQSPIGGVKQEDLDISIEDDMLEIKGLRQEPDKQKNKEYLLQECWWGPFSRKIILPEEADNKKIYASIQEGILIIRIPKTKKEKIKKKKIKIT